MSYPESMTFGRLDVGITQHALDRFEERGGDDHARFRKMLNAVGWKTLQGDEDPPEEDGREFWEGEGWRFVVKDNPTDMAVLTCYPLNR